MIPIQFALFLSRCCMGMASIIIMSSAHATVFATSTTEQTSFPPGCEATRFEFKADRLILGNHKNSIQPYLYFLSNHSNNKIWLNFKDKKEPNAGKSTILDPNNWSVMALDKAEYEFHCIEEGPGFMHHIPCKSALSVCHFPYAYFKGNKKGTYWVIENQSLQLALQGARSSGIEFL